MSEPGVEGEGSGYAARKTVFGPDALRGQTVVVSGGSGGIGSATAWLMARMGAAVAVTGRSEEKLGRVIEAMRSAGHACSAYTLDISDQEAVEETLGRIWSEHEGFDALVNSAGGQFPKAAMDIAPKGWRRVVDINLNGTWWMMQGAARMWRDAGRKGAICNVVVVTDHGLYGIAHSVAARAGVIALSRSVAVEWAEHGIRVNCVAPGAIDTEGWRVYEEDVRKTYARSNPMMHPGDAWDVAEACAYLTAPSGKFVTGELLTVDGGGRLWGETWTIPRPGHFG